MTISYRKGIPLSLMTAAAAVVPSAIYHGASFPVAAGLTLWAAGVALFVDWAHAGRYQWEPNIRPRWFYLNLTAPAVLVLVIQAVGWRVFSESDTSTRMLFGLITFDHLVACIAALVAFGAWIIFSLYLRNKEPNPAARARAVTPAAADKPRQL